MRFLKLAALLSAAMLVSSTASAQQPRQPGGQRQPGAGGGGGFGGGLVNSISRSEPLQKELKVDADQIEKLTAALTKAREDSRELTQKLFNRDTPAEERTEIGKQVREINDKAVATVLKPEQVKRLHQLENQQAGLGLFNRTEIATQLKLTDEQKEKITNVGKDLANDRREIMGAGAGGNGGRGGFGRTQDPEVQKKLQEITKGALENAVKVLNDDQKKTYSELVGEHFDLPANLAFGGGFGAGGAGGFGGFGGGFGGGGQAGTVLSTNAQTQLKLTDDQKKELEVIQKEVDAKLEKMLTEDQRKQLKEMKDRAQNPGAGRGGNGGRGNRTEPKKDN